MKKQMIQSIACFMAVAFIGFCSKGRDRGPSSGSATAIVKPMGIMVSQEIDIGFAALTVTGIGELQKTPFGETPKKKENRFVMVDLVVYRLKANQSIDLFNFLLKTREGEKFSPPAYVFTTVNNQKIEATGSGSIFIYNIGASFQLFFDVPKSIAIQDLDISYAPWGRPSPEKK